uniref:Exocyst subunit Exo70 family protein n=1 Tax=Quercus lobata TaxID=97700 RepID=A0A7N2QZI3_QUELO
MQFEELHQKQSQWTIPDTELQESLRLAVAEVLLPAYRSFVKRFGPLVESGKNPQKYFKYGAEDLEQMLVGLRGFPADRDREFLVGVRGLKSNASKFSCHKVNFFKQMRVWLGQLESTFIPLEPKLPNCKEEEAKHISATRGFPDGDCFEGKK